MNLLFVILIGVAGGLAGALQSQFLGIMEARAGTLASVFVTYGGGGLAVGLLMLAMRGSRLSDLKDVPWWALTAGLMGLVIVATLGITVSRLGLGSGLTLFTGSTLILAAIIDHFGLFTQARPLDARRLAGVALVVFGTWLVVGSD
ncbi:MAG: DMT family transporter [Actinomycetota bacterium]|nr:DMT family transporter [Actinomycetota bacterium]